MACTAHKQVGSGLVQMLRFVEYDICCYISLMIFGVYEATVERTVFAVVDEAVVERNVVADVFSIEAESVVELFVCCKLVAVVANYRWYQMRFVATRYIR